MTVSFTTMRDETHSLQVQAMMASLYAEDPAESGATPASFVKSIEFLLAEPKRGRIVLFEHAGQLRGYAILIPFWSNEYGGTVLVVDELYVVPEARGQGIAHRFFEYLEQERPFDAVAIGLEVTQDNTRARRLYASLGFRIRGNTSMGRALPRRDE